MVILKFVCLRLWGGSLRSNVIACIKLVTMTLYTISGQSWFFVISTWKAKPAMWVFPGSHLYVHGRTHIKRKLPMLLKMGDMYMVEKNAFIVPRYVQHAGWGWTAIHYLCYHFYNVASGAALKEELAFVYGTGLRTVHVERAIEDSASASSHGKYGAKKSEVRVFSQKVTGDK